ncbi:LacI family DNA-binding transcriptional regulator [Sediminispirochaeta bajacaliforniensis]|uniref:LacI family DNA-binding transcriptional regulator n=1 Tax=Sediminispirochaeta bajacaliforniensis TaxID=148 RepID=UPI000364DEB0|nr:LacI family DNA-binding transcriptional regulator [Sediminispirochaeta bajacaliforniensis]
MRELAKLAGVNQSTISRSLNNHPGVSSETRNRIIELAKEHGYYTDQDSPIKQTKEKNVIAVLLADNFFTNYNDHFLESLFIAVFEEIDNANYLPIIVYDQYKSKGIKKVEKLLSIGNIAGVIIINREYCTEIDEYLKKEHVPHIYMHYFDRTSSAEINIIDMNHFLGGYIAAKYLLELGHTNILTATSYGREFEERSSGFAKAMNDAGITVSKNDVMYVDHNFDAGYRFGLNYKEKLREYSALFIQNDLAAIGCIRALCDEGIRIPQDLSVIGYDDIDAGRFCRPTLSTVRQSVRELAKAGVNRITHLISSQETSLMQVFLQPKLIVRESTTQKRKS